MTQRDENLAENEEFTMTIDEQKQVFKTRLCGAIKEKCTQITSEHKKISYNDGKNITAFVELVFEQFLGFCPKQITAANLLALAFIAPTLKEKKKLIKTVVSSMSGLAGLAAILAGIGIAAGWGAGVVASVIAWFTGASLFGPIGLMFVGASLTVCAGYFYFSSDDAKDAERFERVLVEGLDKAIDEIWEEQGRKISEKLTNIQFPQ